MSENREWKPWDKFTFIVETHPETRRGSGMVLPNGKAMLRTSGLHYSWHLGPIPSNAELAVKSEWNGWSGWSGDLEVAAFVEKLLKEQMKGSS